MNNIKNTFLIQDLENLSGIKAHTIRIWEKRYNILEPDRMNRQVRQYDIGSLQKILNISILNNYGHKISTIVKLSNEQIASQAKELALQQIDNSYTVNTLLLAMFSFDESQFQKIYNEGLKKGSFDELFMNVYVPLLQHIGILWQTEAINPAHEHFVSHLIQQKIIYHTSVIKNIALADTQTVTILYLPQGEIHELGLLFLNYLLKNRGYPTIYLGASIPTDNLLFLNAQFDKIRWVSGLIVDLPEQQKVAFLNNTKQLLKNTNNSCWLIGSKWNGLVAKQRTDKIEIFDNLNAVLKVL